MLLRRLICLYAYALTSCNVATFAAEPLLALPPEPQLSEAGYALIIEFEVGGQSNYVPFPEWPAHYSGITVGIGYDCGYNTRENIQSDWVTLPILSANRLAAVSGLTGERAYQHLASLRDITIPWPSAIDVFSRVDVSRTFFLCQKRFKGFDDLRPNAQAALVSLVFNRGDGMVGPNRTEMRAIAASTEKRDYEEMALQIRKMKRVWKGTTIYNGMARRREAEARLMETAATVATLQLDSLFDGSSHPSPLRYAYGNSN